MSVFTNPATGSREHAAAYTRAVVDLVGSRKPLEVLKKTESALRRAVARLTPRRLRAPEAPGKWSMAHVLQHLADSELVWGWRMRLVLAQDRPTLTGYDQDKWAERLGYDRASAAQSIEDFATLRRANLRLLARMTDADLRRVGVHSERGDESVGRMMRLYAGHDLLHINQLSRIRAAVTRAPAKRRR
jgi:uncharacterized damage-inducible protein DinB